MQIGKGYQSTVLAAAFGILALYFGAHALTYLQGVDLGTIISIGFQADSGSGAVDLRITFLPVYCAMFLSVVITLWLLWRSLGRSRAIVAGLALAFLVLLAEAISIPFVASDFKRIFVLRPILGVAFFALFLPAAVISLLRMDPLFSSEPVPRVLRQAAGGFIVSLSCLILVASIDGHVPNQLTLFALVFREFLEFASLPFFLFVVFAESILWITPRRPMVPSN